MKRTAISLKIESGVDTRARGQDRRERGNEDVRRGRTVAAASRRDVEIQYRKSEHTYLRSR